jgi:hypothetical protein
MAQARARVDATRKEEQKKTKFHTGEENVFV